MRILYIDDSDGNRALMRAIVRTQEGWEIETCSDAASGVVAAQRQLPDVILMDIHMPGMNGCDALVELRADQRTQFIPVIAVTAELVLCPEGTYRNVRFDEHVLKPFHKHEVVDTIRRILAKRPQQTP